MRLMRNWGRRSMDVIGVIWIGDGREDRRMGLVIRRWTKLGRDVGHGVIGGRTGLYTAAYLEQQAAGVRERGHHKRLHSIA